MSSVVHVGSTEEFDNEVSTGLVVVDFSAAWCGPCKRIAPKFEELASSGRIAAKFLKVDVDECEEVASRYDIRSIPTFLFFKNGSKQPNDFAGGADSAMQKIEETLRSLL
eukprot:c7146_g1_i1.p2 GENE.c7146_g1_i1~~c7146_g1_i1.p2  ORF type:complete len:110 (-),score=23.66 c7146_g1_i1:83-412(-)